jgi:hypothetical protein
MELQEEITAFVDDQLRDKFIALRMMQLINQDDNMRNEFLIQKNVKTLLHDRFSCCSSPKSLHDKIITGISGL